MPTATRAEQRAFLNGYYGWARNIYDVTRKYYLTGRDRALAELLRQDWRNLVEVGSGTGRNLALLHRERPWARYGGLDASDRMLEVARQRCPWAELAHGFAEDAPLDGLTPERPDRILFSYCLSMVQDQDAALANARSALAPGGAVWVVDFGDLGGLPGPLAGLLRGWLKAFHVEPLDERVLRLHGAEISYSPTHYSLLARIPACA